MGAIIGVILLVLAIGVIALNMNPVVPISLWFTSVNLPVWIVIAGALVLGLLIAWLLALSKGTKNREKKKDQEDKLRVADLSKKEAVEQAKQDSEAQLIQKNAEIEGLKKQVSSLEEELNKHLATADTKSVQDTSTTKIGKTDIAKQDLKSEKVTDSITIEPDDTKQTRVSKNKR
ncbi:lipopolysaccharide assembly protein LapA domain-containing protein [Carnobacterium sp.]|uniref:lipopolysaccharide assembly protein LapA domain-containing protein n=1 Tax=Carnobacterium sp. TaxID=48221 RepID=UPI0028AFD1A2|nr:lipopolysaccharide assembly protein LapA domain-containing protein [Carnobacterium sp.]